MASVFKLGKEVILTKEEELEQQLAQEWNVLDAPNVTLKDFIKYRLWKIRSLPSSSIPYIEAHLSIPTNSLKYDEIDSIDEYYQHSQTYYDHIDMEEDEEKTQNQKDKNLLNFNCRKHFSVKWNVSYILDTDANVSPIFFIIIIILLLLL